MEETLPSKAFLVFIFAMQPPSAPDPEKPGTGCITQLDNHLRKAAKKPLLSLENSGFYGNALQSRYFKFLICHLDILLNGPSGPRRFCGVRAFCHRQNLGGLRPQARFGAQPPRSGGTWRGDGRLRRPEH